MLAVSRRLLIIGLLIFVLGGMVAYLTAKSNFQQGPLATGLSGISKFRAEEEKVEIKVQKFYSDCGHIIPTTLPAGLEDNWLPQSEADRSFLADAGWQLKQEDGYLQRTQEIDDLCPACWPKRHLGFHDGLVAIYQGPAGSLGQLEKVTGIKREALPPFWQQKIESGQAEFNNERELLQALDSLDEYR
ncbi:MAG: hypothetical protein GX039_06415 [Clostridia bacterium]|nr:hypothetical protein [Clostridia bacterium]